MSETPEEQPSTGVLGRIGSWFSPWRGRGPKSPTENASPSGDPSLSNTEGEEKEESEASVRGQQWEDKNPDPQAPFRDRFPREGEDATQSAHRDGSVVSSTGTAGGGPKEEEPVGCRERRRTGQGREREERGNGASASGNPEQNATHLTHLSTSCKQGVAWDSDQAHAQPQAHRQTQAQAGDRLCVYLEETSVIHCGQDADTEKEVFHTTVTKSLHVLPKFKSPSCSDSQDNSAEEKETHVTRSRCHSGPEWVSQKSHKDSQSGSESDRDQTEADSMGRKNTSKRRARKNSQGDGGNTPQEKAPENPPPASDGAPSLEESATGSTGKSPGTHVGKESGNSTSKLSSASPASPEGGEKKNSCPDAARELDQFQDSNSITAATRACAVDGAANMEEDIVYRVQRKTETPESKRRSMKVSRSEVKLFRKYVPLNPKQSPAGDVQEVNATGINTTIDDKKDRCQTEVDGSLQASKKAGNGSKPAVGRLADKINLFEQQQVVVGGHKKTLQGPRSADVSPVRVKASFVLSDQRSRSADRYGVGRSPSESPTREKLMTISERMKIFAEPSVSKAKPALPQKPVMTGMPQRSAPSAGDTPTKSPKLDNQGELEPRKQAKAVSAAIKAGGQDGTAAGVVISTAKLQLTDSQTMETAGTEAAGRGAKPLSVKTDAAAEDRDDSAELSPQPKNLSRTGSRSKRRKSKELSSPISPNYQNKPEFLTSKPKVPAEKQEQVDNTEESVTEKPSLPPRKVQENAAGKQAPSGTEQKTLQRESKESEPVRKESEKKNIDKPDDRQGGLPVSKDEPDTAAAAGSETKKPVDKGPVILPREEGKAEEHRLVFTQKGKHTPAFSSSVAEPSIETPPAEKREPPIERPELDKKLSIQLDSKSKGRGRKPNQKETQQAPNKDAELINEAETKYVEESEKPGSKKTNQAAVAERETTYKFPPTDESVSKAKVSPSGGKVGTAAGNDGITKEEMHKSDTTKPEAGRAEPASQSPEKIKGPSAVQTRHATQERHPENTSMCPVTERNEAVRGSKGDKKPWKVATATNVPPEPQIQSAESPGKETELAVVQGKPQQPKSVSVEKTENSLDDSCAHGANEAELSSTKLVTKATTAVEKGTVKVSNNPPVPITAQSSVSDKAKTGLHGEEGSSVSASQSVKGGEKDDGRNSVAKVLPSEVSGDVTRLSPLQPQPEKSKSTQSKSGVTSLTDAEKASQRPPEATTFSSTFKEIKKSVGETFSQLGDKVSPVANGDISPNSQVQPTEEKPIITKPSQSPKTPTSPEVIKLSADSFQLSSMKKLQLPRGLKDNSSGWQDAPSSWLDVDFPKRKQKVLEPKLTSAGSESNLLDTPDLDDDDFIERIKNLCAPFSLPPRKHNPIRPPQQPPFAMPAIREDRFEKVFDPEEFTIGLRKKTQFTLDTSQSLLSMHQISEPKSAIKPARASITDRCSLLSSLDTHGRLGKTPANDEEGVKEETDDLIKVKSRLEGSCVLSSLTSSSFRGRRNGGDGTGSGDVSPTDSPRVSPPPVSPAPPPSPTNASPFGNPLGNREEAQPVVCDSGPPLPAFDDMKLPDYLQKYLPQNQARPVESIRGLDQVRPESTGKMTTAATRAEADAAPLLPDRAAPGFPGIPPTIQTQQLPAQPHEALRNNVETVEREFHKRPGKMVLFEKAQFNGQAYEIYRDLADATSLRLSPLISVKVVRGCWVLYEKPNFQGRTIALEEGGTELANMWADPEVVKDPQDGPPMQLGSIRLAVGDYSIPHIDLFTEPEGHGRVTPYHDDTIETGSFGIPQSTASIQVHSGVWLVCSDPGFQGMTSVLEKGTYPFPEAWGFPSPFVGSLRPLKMGGFKVENPNDIKAVLYEQPGFEGGSVEIDSDVFDFCDGVNKLTSVGSLKITGGFWVGYSQPGFEGQQHVLEEGEYLDRSDWGGSELLSLRPILSDFMTPHVKMFSDRDFGKLGVEIDLSVPVINMDDTGYGMKTQSVDVISGVWVVFEEPGFRGEPYVLEKGLYGSPEDWGALQHRVGSTMPVLLDDFENTAKFKVQLFSQPGFQGSVLSSEDVVTSLQDGFTVASCKVLAGSWLAFEGPDFTGKVYVLEEGSYPDLRAMGCVSANAAVLSLQPVGFEFSLPSIALFERCGLRGKRVVLADGCVNLPFTGGCGRVQSVLVEGGIWVLYEGINYRGAQILLRPGQVPDWQKFSSWQKIGSLRPLIQKQVHFRLRNRQTGLMMSVTGELDDVKLMRIQEAEETGTLEQIWFYHNGHLHCKVLEEFCLSPIGSVLMAGSRVGLGQESAEQTHRWSITPEGFVRYTHTSDLVLEIKGGLHYDKNQVILNTLDPSKLQQRWDVEVL